MMQGSFLILSDLIDSVRLAFLVPGEIVLAAIAAIAPQTAAMLGFGTGGTVIIFLLALFVWALLLVIGLLISKWCRNLAWQTAALARVFVWRVNSYLGNLKTKLIWKYREFFPHRSRRAEIAQPTEFDSVDLALMRFVSDQGPGMAVSAPDLAQRFNFRPAEVQKRLERLARNNMVRTVIGSTDGYENFRLTDTGCAFIVMWQKQSQPEPQISPASASKSY